MKDLVKIGKYLSLILRHHPERIGITLDQYGWANVEKLIKGMNISFETLEEIVETNNKQRYSFNEDKTYIRANQGHSIPIDLQLEEKTPPDILYHGSATRFQESIEKTGIKKMDRQHVHLSCDIQTAINVGKRHGKPIVYIIDAKKMHEDGYTFYLSKNNVWLTDYIPVQYKRIG